jgi:indolepyruvate ferredoxin oxidoreductase beta subunit
MKQYNLVVAGLGGQGVMTISQVLAAAACRERMDLKLFEGTGITQRGGGVFSFVRFGETYSPKIPIDGADAVLCLEASEIANVIHYLKPGGWIWSNSGRIHGHYTKLRPELYPTQKDFEAMMRLKTSRFRFFPGDRLAQEAGSSQAVNMVMLGVFVRGKSVLKTDSITTVIEETNKRYAAVNLNAFWRGYECAKSAEAVK